MKFWFIVFIFALGCATNSLPGWDYALNSKTEINHGQFSSTEEICRTAKSRNPPTAECYSETCKGHDKSNCTSQGNVVIKAEYEGEHGKLANESVDATAILRQDCKDGIFKGCLALYALRSTLPNTELIQLTRKICNHEGILCRTAVIREKEALQPTRSEYETKLESRKKLKWRPWKGFNYPNQSLQPQADETVISTAWGQFYEIKGSKRGRAITLDEIVQRP